ncbi:MAG: 3-demethylubiquinone-9 3-O-methyltransferase [Planctomycetes bacterium]|nr:3-demethylubiquinone-9 3-O-methyltransferase [Planctomycetota bacterium]
MVRVNDLSIYERESASWWDPRSAAFRSLHSVNAFRVELLREWIGDDLSGRTVADLGCGGGLLAEPLLRAGGRVIGVDQSLGSLRAATERLGARFVRGDLLRSPLADGCADVVLLADVLEHVQPVEAALAEAARVLRPGGFLFVSTINRTARAKLMAVDLAEALRLIPRGTHDHRMFVPPELLRDEASALGLRLSRIQGEAVDVARTALRWAIVLRRSHDLSVGYSALFAKEER